MGNPDTFVLDTNVVSAFYSVGWFDGVSIWVPEREVACPERVWDELEAYWDDIIAPSWLNLQQVDLENRQAEYPGAIAPADWACVLMAEDTEGGCVVTNDSGIHAVAEHRDTPAMWGTAFFLNTFERCGISQDAKDQQVEAYADDLHLPDDVALEVAEAQKTS